MFYTFELLCKQRGGKFSCIYRAATLGIKKAIKDEDLDKLNVVEQGQQICDMITTKSMIMKDRLALRLSAILVNGLIRIHNAQVNKLLEECGGSRSLAFGDLEDIVPMPMSSTELSSELITPEFVAVKKRKPRRPRKKLASISVLDLKTFRQPDARTPERQDETDVIREIVQIAPQRDYGQYPLNSDDSPPEVNQMNILVAVDIHVSAEPPEVMFQEKSITVPSPPGEIIYRTIPIDASAPAATIYRTAATDIAPEQEQTIILQPEVIQQEDAMQVDAAVPDPSAPAITIYRTSPSDMLAPDQTVIPQPETSDRVILRPKTPKEAEPIFIEHKNRPRKINQDLNQESTIKRKRRIPEDKSDLDIGELQCYFQDVNDVNGEFTADQLREAESFIAPENQSLDTIRTPHGSLSHLEMSKGAQESILVPTEDRRKRLSTIGPEMEADLESILVPTEDRRKRLGSEMEGIEILPAIEEDLGEHIHDFSKLSKRVQRLLKRIKTLARPLKISIDDLCRKPVQKKEIVSVFQALLEINANTDIIDLVTKGNEDLYLDYVFIK